MGSSYRRAAFTRFAKDITVGLRWNVTPEFMVRAEYHRVNGTGWLSTLDNPVSGDLSSIGISFQSSAPTGSSHAAWKRILIKAMQFSGRA